MVYGLWAMLAFHLLPYQRPMRQSEKFWARVPPHVCKEEVPYKGWKHIFGSWYWEHFCCLVPNNVYTRKYQLAH